MNKLAGFAKAGRCCGGADACAQGCPAASTMEFEAQLLLFA